MENRKMKLSALGQALAKVNTQRGILQGDSIWPLISVVAMMALFGILRNEPEAANLRREKKG